MGNFNMLPSDVIFNILTRLPTELVLDCKLVSKTWNHFISHKSFAGSHLNHCLNNLDSSSAGGSGKVTCLFVNDNPIHAFRVFHYLEYVENSSEEEKPFHRVRKVKLIPAPFRYYNFTGSCNGLVCLNGCHNNEWVNYEPVYICNPITRECVYLPPFEFSDDRGERLLTGFGYVASTNEYKVVRVYNLLEELNSMYVEVYTLGSGKGWMNIGKKLDKDPDQFMRPAVFANGCLYWELDGQLEDRSSVVAFDLANESLVELPNFFPTGGKFTLGGLGGSLSATHYDKDSGTSDIWLLKKKEDGSFGWNKEFSLRDADTDTQDSALQETLGCTCKGTVLCHTNTKVLSHDLNSSSWKMLVDFGMDKCIFQGTPHINTLISLKALGEENIRTMESVEPPKELVEDDMFDYDKKVAMVTQMCMQQ